MFRNLFLTVLTIVLLSSCAVENLKYTPQTGFQSDTLISPDYSEMKYWIAHPEKKDMADKTPSLALQDNQDKAVADVFFVYPTIYVGKYEHQIAWNASVEDDGLNNEIGNTTIKNQATVFNGVAKVYSPLYRQAHLYAYYGKKSDQESIKKAFDFAYEDVKRAFIYYMENHNDGRPYFIASHSQGTDHAERLIKEFFKDDEYKKNFVAAYLVGRPVIEKEIENLNPCETEFDAGCYTSWNVYKDGYYPDSWKKELRYATATNPLNWKIDETYAGFAENKGSLMRDFELRENLIDAKVHKGMIWVGKPNIFGGAFLNKKRWHVAEYNLYYISIRQNVDTRLDAWFRKL